MTELNDKEHAIVVPLQKYLDDADFISKFSDVSSALAASNVFPESCKLDATSIAKICWEILNFMESVLGKHSPVTTRQTMSKIPMKLFLDRSSDGSLFGMLTIALAYKEKAGWDDFNLSLPERNTDGLAILRSIQSSLLETQKLQRHRVFFSKVALDLIPELTQIVERHGGSVVETDIEASHIIMSDELIDSLPSELPEDYLRVVDGAEARVEVLEKTRVHWIFHPDSYDDEIDTQSIDGDISAEQNSRKSRSVGDSQQWRVCVRFIRDCEIFNEWGNEVDYELEDADATKGVPSSAPSSKGSYAALKRRSASNSSSVAMDIPDEISAEKGALTDDADGCASDVVETGQTNVTGNPALKRKADSPDEASLSVSGKPKKGSRKSLQSQLKSPTWFSADSVNSLEITNLPEFFSHQVEAGTAKTETYIEIRNFIVTLYSSNPYVFLSATECRRRIAGDVCVILKIHNFLDTFGVINFNVKSDCRPTLSAPMLYPLSKSTSTAPAAQLPLLPNNSTSSSSGGKSPSDSGDEEWLGEWTSDMDRVLLESLIAESGNWSAVARLLRDSDGSGPSALECVARVIYLPSTSPSTLKSAVGSSASKAAIRSAHLSYEIAYEMGAALGCKAAQAVVVQVLGSLAEDSDADQVSLPLVAGLSKREMQISVAVAAAAVATLAMKDSEKEQKRLESLLNDYIMHRMTALEEKVKILAEVDHMIDLEKERLEVDRRDAQIQRAQLAFKLLGQQGS